MTLRKAAMGCLFPMGTTAASFVLCIPLSEMYLEWTEPWVGRAIEGTVVKPLPGEVTSGFVLLTKEGQRLPITHYNTMRGLPDEGDKLSKPAHETTFDITFPVKGKEHSGKFDTFHPLEGPGPLCAGFAFSWVALNSLGALLVSCRVKASKT